MRKIPSDAFETYLAMGEGRSYQVLADKYGVSKRSITKRAAKEGWQERIQTIERRARERAEEEYAESLQAVNNRHLRTLRAIQGKALQALQAMPLKSGMDAVRALDLSIKQERVVLGEPSERQAVTGSIDHVHRLDLAVIAAAVERIETTEPPEPLPQLASGHPHLPEITNGPAAN